MAKTIAIKIDVQGTAEQQKKLAQLETEVKKLTNRRTQLNKAVKEGTISLAQYGKEMARINTKLKANRREMLVARENILGLDSFTTKLGKSFRRLGNSITGAFAGLFAVQKLFQLIGDAVQTLEEFELQMAKVKAITGATEAEMTTLTNSAKELGRSSQFTASQVGELQEELAKLGFTTPEILAASDAILQLATATGSELSESAVVAASTLRGFGLEANEMQRIVDVMAKSFTSSALDMEKFKVSMRAVAPVAKTVGLSVEETTASLGVLVDSGFRAETAGTALRNILLDTRKAGISVSEAFEQIRNSTDPATTSLELFGKENAAAAIMLANSTTKTNDLTNALMSADGTAKDMADTIGNTAVGASKRFESAWEGVTLSLGEGTEEGLASAKNLLADFLNSITDISEEVNKLRSIGDDATFTSMFGLTDYQEELINVMNTQDEFFKNNLSNREELQKELMQSASVLKGLKEQIKTADEDEAERLKLRTSAEYKYFLRISEQIKALKEKQKQQESSAELTKVQEEVEAKVAKKSKEQIKLEDKILEETKKANEKLVEDILNLKNDALILEIEDKIKAEDKKLDIAEQSAIREVELSKASTNLKEQAILAIQSKYQAQRDAINRKRKEDDDKQALEDAEKLKKQKEKQKEEDNKEAEAKKEFKKQVNAELYDLGEQAANALVEVSNRKVEREKTLELAALDAKLQQGLISQDEFEKQRYAIEKKAFQRQKRLELAQVAISLAREIAAINASAAANPTNAFTFGAAGLTQAQVLTGIAVARSAVQAGIIASQSFAEGGFTGSGFGSPDASGFKQAGVVHEGEYVVPKNVLETNRGGALVGALESMRLNRPQPYIGTGFANGGFTSMQSVDITGLKNEITQAVAQSIGAIQVVNNATDTVSEAVKVSNIQSDATFG